MYPNHGVHFAGFVAGFFVMMVLLSLGFLAINLISPRTRLNLLQQTVSQICVLCFGSSKSNKLLKTHLFAN